jgi:hypothetical protein
MIWVLVLHMLTGDVSVPIIFPTSEACQEIAAGTVRLLLEKGHMFGQPAFTCVREQEA